MRKTANSSSSQRNDSAADRFVMVPLELLRTHPANANVMGGVLTTKLTANIKREADYPPLIVRPMPGEDGAYQILDGHQRYEALRRLGHKEACCYVWPCDDQTALLLLTTLNRLEGQDEPWKRAELLQELTALISVEKLAQLVPEDETAIRHTLALLDLDLDALLAELAEGSAVNRDLRSLSFAVSAADEVVIEDAIARSVTSLAGPNRRGSALAQICRAYLDALR